MLKDSSLEARIIHRDVRLGRSIPGPGETLQQKIEAEIAKDDNAEVLEEECDNLDSADEGEGDVAKDDEPNDGIRTVEPEVQVTSEDIDIENMLTDYINYEDTAHRVATKRSNGRDGDDNTDPTGKRRKIAMARKYRPGALNYCSRIKSINSVNEAIRIMEELDEENRPSRIGVIGYNSKDNPSSCQSMSKWLKSVYSKVDVSCLFQAAVKLEAKGGMPSPHEENEMDWWKDYFNGYDFCDDVNGDKKLPWEEVLKARKLEMDFFKKMGVYSKVPRGMAKKDGCKIISAR